MTDLSKSLEPDLEIQYFDDNVLCIGASGVSAFSEAETMAKGLILEYDREGAAVGVVLTRSALDKLRHFLKQGSMVDPETSQKEKKVSDGV